MSREIKFRAWDIEERCYYYGAERTYDGLQGCHATNFGDVLDSPDSFIVEQFTGLYDENGEEIYEGDIVRVSYGYNYEVRQFKSGAWRIGRDDLCVWADSSEVIGNIHENPELLEAK